MAHSPVRGWRFAVTAAAATSLVGSIAACGSDSSPSASTSPPSSVELTNDESATITIWSDSTRQTGFEAYQESHPDVKLSIETYDPASLLTKIQLFNRTDEGWPDLVFISVPDNVASLATEQFENFATPLNDAIPADVQEGFGSANEPCTINGQLVCLKNDIGQSVLWYNKTLMDEWGYEVPTTWAEYEALGLQVAADHPGYVIGSAGDVFAAINYFVPSGCPLTDTKGSSDEVHIDATDPACTRVATMLDTLLEAGAVSKLGIVDPGFLELGAAGKILMLPGASFFGDFLFKPEAVYKYPAGQLAAATMPTWDEQDEAWSGNGGGGIYVVSSHSKNQVRAAAIAQWMATSPDYQTTQPSYPAYEPAVAAWAERISADAYYAEDPYPAMRQQANLINPVQQYVRYDFNSAWTTTVSQAVAQGSSIADLLESLQSQLEQLAQSAGYSIVS